ncbi:MAG: hypothetical protein R3F23_05995 [Verrucomicrobiia bacterium]
MALQEARKLGDIDGIKRLKKKMLPLGLHLQIEQEHMVLKPKQKMLGKKWKAGAKVKKEEKLELT